MRGSVAARLSQRRCSAIRLLVRGSWRAHHPNPQIGRCAKRFGVRPRSCRLPPWLPTTQVKLSFRPFPSNPEKVPAPFPLSSISVTPVTRGGSAGRALRSCGTSVVSRGVGSGVVAPANKMRVSRIHFRPLVRLCRQPKRGEGAGRHNVGRAQKEKGGQGGARPRVMAPDPSGGSCR